MNSIKQDEAIKELQRRIAESEEREPLRGRRITAIEERLKELENTPVIDITPIMP